jgi:hypothetical protein
MADQGLQKTLLDISTSLLSVQKQLDHLKDSPALNGAFDEICRQVKELHETTHRIEEMLISPTSGEGLVMRVKELEGDNETRKEFMSTTVMPSLEQHRQMVFKMKLFDEQIVLALTDLSFMKAEVATLKLKQAIQSKVGWAIGLGVIGLIVARFMNLIMSGVP